jgi:hypothetical protein
MPYLLSDFYQDAKQYGLSHTVPTETTKYYGCGGSVGTVPVKDTVVLTKAELTLCKNKGVLKCPLFKDGHLQGRKGDTRFKVESFRHVLELLAIRIAVSPMLWGKGNKTYSLDLDGLFAYSKALMADPETEKWVRLLVAEGLLNLTPKNEFPYLELATVSHDMQRQELFRKHCAHLVIHKYALLCQDAGLPIRGQRFTLLRTYKFTLQDVYLEESLLFIAKDVHTNPDSENYGKVLLQGKYKNYLVSSFEEALRIQVRLWDFLVKGGFIKNHNWAKPTVPPEAQWVRNTEWLPALLERGVLVCTEQPYTKPENALYRATDSFLEETKQT